MGEHVRAGDLDIWTEQVGEGPDVLLIGGAGDTVESWQFQLDGLADRYRLTAFDNRGAGRTAMPDEPVSIEVMADDAADVLRALDVRSAHVAGFSGGSIVSQELALRHPELVRSLVLQSTWPAMDPYYRSWVRFVQWLVEYAPSERAFLEGFFLDIYTARAHNDGTVDQFIEEVLAFPHKQKAEDLQRYLDALVDHDTTDRLPEITRPDARARRRPRPGRAPRALPPRRRADPRRPVRGDGGGGPPALPGGPGRVERPRRRLLARGRGARLRYGAPLRTPSGPRRVSWSRAMPAAVSGADQASATLPRHTEQLLQAALDARGWGGRLSQAHGRRLGRQAQALGSRDTTRAMSQSVSVNGRAIAVSGPALRATVAAVALAAILGFAAAGSAAAHDGSHATRSGQQPRADVNLRGCWLTVALIPASAEALENAFQEPLVLTQTFYGPDPLVGIWSSTASVPESRTSGSIGSRSHSWELRPG